MKSSLITCGLLLLSEFIIADASHALTLTLSNGTTGPSGVTDQGSFVDSFTPAQTVDFNSTAAGDFAVGSTQTFALTGGSVSLKAVTGVNNAGQGLQTQFLTNATFAPKGPGPSPTPFQDNASRYLAVFSGVDIEITFANIAPDPITSVSTNFNSVSLFGVNFGLVDNSNRIILETINNANVITTRTVALNAADASAGFGLNTLINPRTGVLLARNDDAFITLVSDTSIGERITKVTLRQDASDTTAANINDRFGGLETENYAFTFYPTAPTAVPFEFSPLAGIVSLAALYKIRKFISKKNQ